MGIAGIYAITDPELLPGEQLYRGVECVLRGGVRLLQYRDKNATWAQRLERAKRLSAACRQFGAVLIINDDVALAAAIGAAGVHLGLEDTSVASARAQLGASALIGATCHADVALGKEALQQGASYCAFGRFFPSSTKPEAPPAPLQVLQTARSHLPLPLVAIGGIRPDNIADLVRAGAHSVAMCHSLFGHDDIECNAREMVTLFNQLSNSD